MENSTPQAGGSAAGTMDSNSLKRGVDAASSALHSSIDKMVDPALDTVGMATNVAHDAVNRLSSGASQMADRVAEQASRVSEASGRAVESSKSWVQGKPLEAVGMALVLGFIIGRLTAN